MNASDLTAIVSVCIAGLALVQSRRATREANELMKQQVALQDRLTQIEHSREHAKLMQALRAIIRAELRNTDRGNWRLFVTNSGKGAARNVTILLGGKPLLEHPAIPRDEEEVKLIGPESDISYCMVVNSSCQPPFEFSVTWDDESGEQGQYTTTLTL